MKKEYALAHFKFKQVAKVFSGWNHQALPTIKLKNTLIGAVKRDTDIKTMKKVFGVFKTFKNFKID